MESRGPDGQGQWISNDQRLGLAHRRLAIIDLTDSGAQPMFTDDRSLGVVFNGEIYNHESLRSTLVDRGHRFRGSSDTEVLLSMYREYGTEMLGHLRGMFAFGLWDVEQKTLLLARDVYGVKPLYYADDGERITFGSQVKALLADPAMSREPDPAGLAGFAIWGSVPEPHTMFAAIKALPAGSFMTVSEIDGVSIPTQYDSVAAIVVRNQDDDPGDTRTAVLDSVRHHLVADVEVGCFLSAGVDSGALVGLMRDCGADRIRTITLAFSEYEGTERDESVLANRVAEYYGVDHQVRTISPAEFADAIPQILRSMDQPSIDGVNAWFVARATHEMGLKVALSGLGGDELLAGYTTFETVPRILKGPGRLARIPGLGPLADRLWRPLARLAFSSKPKVAGVLRHSRTLEDAYLLRRCLVMPEDVPGLATSDRLRAGAATLLAERGLSALLDPLPDSMTSRIAVLESGKYMRDQLLRDADWAGMAHSLEIRVPFVDTHLLAAIAPIQDQLDAGAGKRLLASAPSLPLPSWIVERAKTGFGIPVNEWTTRAAKGAVRPGLGAWAGHVLEDYSEQTGLRLDA